MYSVVPEAATHFFNLTHQKPTDQKPTDSPSASIGTHCLLELYDCPAHLLNDLTFIEAALKEAAQVACSTLLSLTSQAFQPQGVTALALLAESHISIHTWPETGYAAVDVFTCGEHTRPQAACDYLAEQMQSQNKSIAQLLRRGPLPASSERAFSEQTSSEQTFSERASFEQASFEQAVVSTA